MLSALLCDRSKHDFPSRFCLQTLAARSTRFCRKHSAAFGSSWEQGSTTGSQPLRSHLGVAAGEQLLQPLLLVPSSPLGTFSEVLSSSLAREMRQNCPVPALPGSRAEGLCSGLFHASELGKSTTCSTQIPPKPQNLLLLRTCCCKYSCCGLFRSCSVQASLFSVTAHAGGLRTSLGEAWN